MATLALFAYVAVILSVSVPWKQAIAESLRPWAYLAPETTVKDYAAMVVAVLGTTISPYLFFLASQPGSRRRPAPAGSPRAAHPQGLHL